MRRLLLTLLFAMVVVSRTLAQVPPGEPLASIAPATVPLTGKEQLYCTQGGADARCDTNSIATTGMNDPYSFFAAGTIGTTTGTISIGTNSLVVANASGWTIGMGIAVANAGTGGTTELITKVTGISGTTFTLQNNAIATATGQVVNHDDTVAWSAAQSASLVSGQPLRCRAGQYNYTSVFPTITAPFKIVSDGSSSCVLVARGKTNNTFNVEYFISGLPPSSLPSGGVDLGGFSIRHAVAPTAGVDILVRTGGTGTQYVYAADIHDIVISGAWVGILTQQGSVGNSFHDISMFGCVSNGILYGADIPTGQDKFNNIYIGGACASGSGAAVNIFKGANVAFNNITITGGGQFIASPNASGDLTNLMINNLTVVGNGSQGCAINLQGTFGPIGATLVGGYLGGATAQICSSNAVISKVGGDPASGFSMTGVVFGNTSNTVIGVMDQKPSWKVSDLPACGSGTVGMDTYVSDAMALTYSNPPVGGGTFRAHVVCLGTSGWVMQ